MLRCVHVLKMGPRTAGPQGLSYLGESWKLSTTEMLGSTSNVRALDVLYLMRISAGVGAEKALSLGHCTFFPTRAHISRVHSKTFASSRAPTSGPSRAAIGWASRVVCCQACFQDGKVKADKVKADKGHVSHVGLLNPYHERRGP